MKEIDVITILETLARGIRDLETKKILMELEIDRLKAKIVELEKKLKENTNVED